MSGWECLSLLNSDGQLCNIPVIMYSTSSVTVDGRKAIDHGATGFLEKPSSYIKLREFLEKIVAASAQEFGKELRKLETSKAHALMAAW